MPTRPARGIWSARALVALTLSWCPIAAAQSASADAAARAEELKAEGRALLVDRKHAAALERFEEAQRLNPSDVTLFYNIARALEFMGQYPRALDNLEQFVAKAPEDIRARVSGLTELVAEVRSHVGSLTVVCTPSLPRAEVFLDDRRIADACAGAPIRVRTGKGRLRVDADGYFAVEVPVDVGASPSQVPVRLEPRATSGKLRIRSSPAGANVSVAGAPLGNAPVETVLPAGEYAVSGALDGFQDIETRVVVEKAATRDVTLELRKNAPLTSKWWFWTAIGVVVVGGATAAILVANATEKDPRPGSIDPGIVETSGFRF